MVDRDYIKRGMAHPFGQELCKRSRRVEKRTLQRSNASQRREEGIKKNALEPHDDGKGIRLPCTTSKFIRREMRVLGVGVGRDKKKIDGHIRFLNDETIMRFMMVVVSFLFLFESKKVHPRGKK